MSSTTLTSSSSTATATGDCITVAPGRDGYIPEYACNSNWAYFPNFAAAILFATLFGISTFAHIYQAFYHKKKRLCWPLIMGIAWEFGGFAVRSAGSKHQDKFVFAYISQLLILVAPMWINAFIYMVMGRMIYFFIPEKQIWGVKGIKVAKIFVWLDILAFLVQVVGGSMLSSDSDSTMKLGTDIYMAGIGFQEFCILIFTSIAIKFLLTMRRLSPSNLILDTHPTNWRWLLYAMFTTLALITIRIIFRLVEFSSGTDADKNPIPFHEAYFYCLDGAPMFIACLVMNVVHPGRVLMGEGSEFPRMTRKEKKAAKQAKKDAKKTKKDAKKAKKEEKMMREKFGTGYGRDEVLLESV